jgi:hypothetical protein
VVWCARATGREAFETDVSDVDKLDAWFKRRRLARESR